MKARALFKKQGGSAVLVEFSTDSADTALRTALTIVGRKELHQDDFLEIHLLDEEGKVSILSFGDEKKENIPTQNATQASLLKLENLQAQNTREENTTAVVLPWHAKSKGAPIVCLQRRLLVARSKANA